MSGDHRHYSNLMAIAPNVSIIVFVPQSRLIRLHSTLPQPRVECLVWLDCAAAAPMILEINNWYWAVLRRTFHSRDPYPFQPVHLSPRHHKPDSSLSSISIQQRPLSVWVLEMSTNLREVSQLFFAVKLREGPLRWQLSIIPYLQWHVHIAQSTCFTFFKCFNRTDQCNDNVLSILQSY